MPACTVICVSSRCVAQRDLVFGDKIENIESSDDVINITPDKACNC